MHSLRPPPAALLSLSVLVVCLTLYVPQSATPTAYATNFVVNSTADAVNANPGNGVCETAVPGQCTLRAAIQKANALPGPKTIILPAGIYTLTIPGTFEDEAATGDLDITDDLILIGEDAATTIIDGSTLDRVFDIGPGATATLSDLTIRRQLGDERQAAYLLGNLGIVARRQGQPVQALARYEESLALRRQLGDRWGIANCLNNMGNVNMDLERYEAAQAHLEEALAIQRELGDRWMIGNALNNLGNVARAQADYERALRLYRKSLDIYGALQDKWALAYLFEDLGWLLAQQNQGEAALQLVGAASVLRQEIGAPLTASESEKLNGALAEAIRPLSPTEREAATEAGKAMSLAEALLYTAEAAL